MKDKIRSFIVETLRRNNQDTLLDDDDSLIKSHKLDSLDVVDLLLYIEELTSIPPAALGDDFSRIDSINLIIEYISLHIKIHK